MSACIDNYVNGNLTEAKAQAKHTSFLKLREELNREYGKSPKVADAIASYLKGFCTFQQACNVEDAESI